ncbi:unnamed protein product [Onchocerca flexuosa]|uniref:Fam20C domain-containing protein n=1 Tax=Onchocerca flexuosa TaxID=387005 RepID=A0A183HUM4_9BILA|nr:unnamed protein product [Onchocerca flexuosa]
MSKDPLAPILAYKHYPAMERRLHKIMFYIDKCIRENPDGPEGVIMAEYHNNEVPLIGGEEAWEDDESNNNNNNKKIDDDNRDNKENNNDNNKIN